MNTVMGTLFHTSVPEILKVLSEGTPITAVELQNRIGIDNSGLQKTLKILKRKGLTDRNELDKRWFLTSQGKEAAIVIVRCMDRLEEVLG